MGDVHIVVSEDARDFQRRNWSALVQQDPAGSFFHQPAFLKLYWEEFGETPDHLLLAFAEEDDGTQVGAVAFERIGETLRFLGGTEVIASQIFFPDSISKEVFNEWQPYREHVSKRRTFNDNDPIRQGVYSEVTRQSRSYAAKAVLVVAPRK